MGAVFSSSGAGAALETLERESCPPGHPVWARLSLGALTGLSRAPDLPSLLSRVRARQPANYATLVRATTDELSRVARSADSESLPCGALCDACDFVCALLSAAAGDCAPWFESPRVYLTAVSPVAALMQAAHRLLRLAQPAEAVLSDAAQLTLRVRVLQVLGFVANRAAFGDCGGAETRFAGALDLFPSSALLPPLLALLPQAVRAGRSDAQFQLVRAAVCVAVPCLYHCVSWKVSGIDQNLINRCFLPLAQSAGGKLSRGVLQRVVALEEFYVSFLFAVMLKFRTFTEFVSVYKLSNDYIAGLLYLFQSKYENDRVTFLHTLVLLVLSRITSMFPALLSLNEQFGGSLNTVYKTHHRTYADLLIEIITNPLIDDMKGNVDIVSLVVHVILNISATTVSLSCFSANRIFKLFNKIILMKSMERHEHSYVISQMLLAIYQILRFQPLGNVFIFMFCLENIKIIRLLSKNNKCRKYTEKIIEIIEASEKSLSIKDEKLRMKTLQESIAPVLNKFDIEPAKQSEFPLGNRLKEIWVDWFRVLYYVTFPEESEMYDIRFSCFEFPRKAVKQSQSTAEQPQTVMEAPNVHLPDISVTIDEGSTMKADAESPKGGNAEPFDEEVLNQHYSEANEPKEEDTNVDKFEITENPFGENDEFAKFLDE